MKIVILMMILYHFNYYLVLPKSNVKKIIQSSAFTSTELNPSLDSIITILNIYNQDAIKFASFQVNKIVVVAVSYFIHKHSYTYRLMWIYIVLHIHSYIHICIV
jgi:hypothetical protein